MKRLLINILIVWLGHICNTLAQTLFPTIDPYYESKVKLVDEFFDRFNGKEITPYVNANDSDFQKKNLLSLLNFGMFKSREDSLFQEAKEMMDKILRDSISINYRDSCWFAKANCLATVNGNKTEITVWLNVEKRTEYMSKWVIAAVEGDILKLTPPQTKHNMMLLPNDHETNFISLHRMTKDTPKQSLRFSRKDFTVDETSVFFALVNQGLLRVEYVTDLQFVFYQVPEYVFTISFFERENTNSGWLISSFEKMLDKNKKQFIFKMQK